MKESNSLDPDHALRFVRPDLGPSCLQGYQQTTLVSKQLMLSESKSICSNC